MRIEYIIYQELLSYQVAKLIQTRMAIAEKHKETLMLTEHLQSKVLDEELVRWKRDQQLAGNGAPFTTNNNLDKIQVSIGILNKVFKKFI